MADLYIDRDMEQRAYQLDLKAFQNVYDFIRRYAERNENDVQIVLFTAHIKPDTTNVEISDAMKLLEQAVFDSLRRSDVSTRYSDSQIVVILMDANSDNGSIVANRILESYENSYKEDKVSFTYEITKIEGNSIFGTFDNEQKQMRNILVVDDDKLNLMTAKGALGDLYKVAAASSGEKALDYLKNNSCDLILLDLVMPVMDGFEVMARIREIPKYSETPIIFLTGDRNSETENKCLKAGAVDYIQKPFVVDILRTRIGRTLELFDLRNNLQQMVLQKTEHIETLSNSIINALAYTIDAKDRYTSGHSQRVAQYSQMIAAKMGKSREEQDEIYKTGLLHDVGKIRVPATVINKAGKLNDDEFELIKLHPITGYHILREISGEKLFSEGARFHHERYDGKGYPMGLAGDQIPEVARIVGVADAYDAMSSNRSYRNALPQEVVRAEIEKCKGMQFDPAIADIMLELIDGDKDYRMKEMAVGHRRILVIDDNSENVEIIKSYLKDNDLYSVTGCNGCADAIDILKSKAFDIIFLDVKEPALDYYEIAAKIREFSNIPIVLTTADKSLIDMDLAKRYDIADFIIRAFKPSMLIEILHAVLG